jgi:Rap1a immunity proteins
MNSLRASLFAAWLICIASVASAQAPHPTSAIALLPGCRSSIGGYGTPGGDTTNFGPWNSGYCSGLIAGVVMLGGGLPNDDKFCAPGVSLEQALLVVIKYIEARPERLHEQLLPLALEALHKAWPCKQPITRRPG